MRRGDKVNAAAPITYIMKAIHYFQSELNNTIFIVTSDNIEWCKANIINSNGNIYFSKYDSSRYLYDFVLLSSCNHSIITVGTFGWFAAWLAGGKVVHYGGFLKQNQKIADHYPNDWISML